MRTSLMLCAQIKMIDGVYLEMNLLCEDGDQIIITTLSLLFTTKLLMSLCKPA